MADAKVRDRIVKIKRVYDEPKEMADKGDYKIFSWGIKLEDGNYCNINGTANDLDSFKKKVKDKFYVDGDKIKEGESYKVYEESSDEENKYWNVTAFVKIDSSAEKKDEKTVKEYNDTQQLKILKGQCLNIAGEFHSKSDKEFDALAILGSAEELFKKCLETKWLEK